MPNKCRTPGRAELNKKLIAYKRLLDKANKRKLRAKRYRRKWNPKIGDLILVRDHKLSSLLKSRYHRMELLYKEPYRIERIFGEHTYEVVNLNNSKIEGRFHKQLLRPYKTLEK